MLSFSLCNKKRLAIRHMNRPHFPTTLSIPSYDIGKYVGLKTYEHSLVQARLVPPIKGGVCVCVCVCVCVQCIFSVHCDSDTKYTPYGQTAAVCYSKWYTLLALGFQAIRAVCTSLTSARFTSTPMSPLNHQLEETYKFMNRIFTVLVTVLTVV